MIAAEQDAHSALDPVGAVISSPQLTAAAATAPPLPAGLLTKTRVSRLPLSSPEPVAVAEPKHERAVAERAGYAETLPRIGRGQP